MARIRRRILLAVKPSVLEGALVTLLANGGRADVVRFQEATVEDLSRPCDAAIVTAGLAEGVRADLLITLPDTELGRGGGGRVACVTVNGLSSIIKLCTNDAVFELLSTHFRAEMPNVAQVRESPTLANILSPWDEGSRGDEHSLGQGGGSELYVRQRADQ